MNHCYVYDSCLIVAMSDSLLYFDYVRHCTYSIIVNNRCVIHILKINCRQFLIRFLVQ